MRTVITTTYPGQSILTEEYKERIIDYINEFEYVLKSNYFNNRKNGYRKYIDIDSFINFAMINEIFKNIDGGDVSTYFYKDIGGLMKAGPVWDFDLSLGNSLNNEDNSPAGFKMINTIWFDRLFQDEYFANRYKDILYPYYRSTIWTNRKIENMIDNAVKELGPAVKRNSDRWYLNYTEENYQKEIEDIKTFFNNRFSWMDNNIHLIKRILENPE